MWFNQGTIRTLFVTEPNRPVTQTTVDRDDISASHRLADTGRKRGNLVVRIPHTHPEGAPVMIEAPFALVALAPDSPAAPSDYLASVVERLSVWVLGVAGGTALMIRTQDCRNSSGSGKASSSRARRLC